MSTSLCSIAEEYFNSINQLARRISADIQVKKEAYEEVWKCLSRKEQRQVMDETIIHPEAVLKYAAYPQDNPDYEYFPKLRLQTGEKYVVDEEGGKGVSLTWRDEHSAPFSWMTQSQLNLNVLCNKTGNTETIQPTKSKPKPSPPKRAPKPIENFEPPSIVLGGSSVKNPSNPNKSKSPNEKDSNKSVVQEENFLSKLRSKTAVLKLPPKGKTSKSSKGESESLVKPGGSCVIKIKPKTVIAKPKTPPPPPPPKPKKENRSPETKEADRESIGTWEEPANHGAHEEEMALLTRVKEDDIVKKNKDVSQEAKVEQYPVIEAKVSDTPALVPSASADLLATFNVDLNPSQDIPKTGFEFLDNW
ncbi:hypothetical protein J437_LFUL008877 [Ladona fulva]|uniref:DUF4706 domain-containing protein n=1 Tax=Ladona fulva TaxID=123851 RepID=A0A8K0KCM5_LADFU|nr:hypothetical protein J437_LFUL008877 [Ladona fulva]